MIPGSRDLQPVEVASLLRSNPTLNSIVRLCRRTNDERSPISAVVSYNYDNLLELGLVNTRFQSIWKGEERLIPEALPVYHVHGFIPIEGPGSRPGEIVFTEEQYYLAAQNAYSWSNLVQIKYLSSSIGLMVGLSLTDRNMRRLLDALRKSPVRSENYILLREPIWPKPKKAELKRIDTKAREYYEKFRRSGLKSDERKYLEIIQIIEDVQRRDVEEEKLILEEFGVHPIWYKKHDQVPQMIERVLQP